MHGNVLELSDSLQNSPHLARFDFELVRVIDVLVSTSAAMSEVGASRFDTMRRSLANVDDLTFSELFFLARDLCRDEFAIDGEWNKNGFAMFAPDAFAAEGNVLDL